MLATCVFVQVLRIPLPEDSLWFFILTDNPQIEDDLPETKIVVNTGDLHVSCTFQSKPAVSVTWKLEDDSSLPDIFKFSTASQEEGKLNVSTVHFHKRFSLLCPHVDRWLHTFSAGGIRSAIGCFLFLLMPY